MTNQVCSGCKAPATKRYRGAYACPACIAKEKAFLRFNHVRPARMRYKPITDILTDDYRVRCGDSLKGLESKLASIAADCAAKLRSLGDWQMEIAI